VADVAEAAAVVVAEVDDAAVGVAVVALRVAQVGGGNGPGGGGGGRGGAGGGRGNGGPGAAGGRGGRGGGRGVVAADAVVGVAAAETPMPLWIRISRLRLTDLRSISVVRVMAASRAVVSRALSVVVVGVAEDNEPFPDIHRAPGGHVADDGRGRPHGRRLILPVADLGSAAG